ncbi:MAG: MBL fold metallo-hydrolase [Clostridiaceae bacterium]|nr:MBL fold metallo-hydrolase [Clostridiaceae bacterium]
MEIIWKGHSCFLLKENNYTICIDPYIDDMIPGLSPLRVQADAVYCSHGHNDHAWTDAVTLSDSGEPSPFNVIKLPSFHDEEEGAKRGANTIHIFECGNLRVAHLGDLGHLPNQQQLQACGLLDAAMVPVGGFYTIDAKTAQRLCGLLDARVIIPMHYRTKQFGLLDIGTLDQFLAFREDVKRYRTDTLTLDADTPRQTAVLKYQD